MEKFQLREYPSEDFEEASQVEAKIDEFSQNDKSILLKLEESIHRSKNNLHQSFLPIEHKDDLFLQPCEKRDAKKNIFVELGKEFEQVQKPPSSRNCHPRL